jgi:hypothetical protein
MKVMIIMHKNVIVDAAVSKFKLISKSSMFLQILRHYLSFDNKTIQVFLHDIEVKTKTITNSNNKIKNKFQDC